MKSHVKILERLDLNIKKKKENNYKWFTLES